MDNKKAVVVLAPNGRRQTVKVSPNSTILQILEEVCKKQGLNPEEFDIKHHNKCLDTSAIFRFSGLPNNAQLELAQATKTRLEGTVVLGVQLENGTRLMGDFNPGNSLWDVLIQLCPDETNPSTNTVVIYMRREIYGQASFQETTLRSLGLTNGRAILRIIHRSPEELRVQANVAAPLPSRPVEEKPYLRTFIKCDEPVETPITDVPRQDVMHNQDEVTHEPKQPKTDHMAHENKPAKSNKQDFLTQYIKREKQNQPQSSIRPSTNKHVAMDVDPYIGTEKEKTVAEEEFIFLGTRNAMIFSQETAQSIPSEDLPDDFFELTIKDAKKLLRDIKKARSELENAPLQTSALRNLQQSTRQLSNMNRYKQSVIRINFPDHTVLQGTFSPIDTISTVLEFVREYLEDKRMDFYLYTAPPKNVLDTKSRLVEIGCVPTALLHFGTKILSKDEKYLQSNLISKFTTPSIASLAAARTRKQGTRTGSTSQMDDELLEDEQPNDVNVGASTSTGESQYEDYPARTPKESEKMPKWFKPTK